MLPIKQEATAGLAQWGQWGDADAGSTSTCSTQGQHGDGCKLDSPGEGVCSRDCFAMMVLLPTLGRSDNMLKHSLTSLHPKLLLPSNPCSHTAFSMEECTGTSCRVLRMHSLQAGSLLRGCPGQLRNRKRALVPAPLQGTDTVGSMHSHRGSWSQRPGPAAPPQLSPVMAWWERVGSPEPIAPATSQASRDRAVCPEALEPGDRDSWAPGLHPAAAAIVQIHLPMFLGAACMLVEELDEAGLRALQQQD